MSPHRVGRPQWLAQGSVSPEERSPALPLPGDEPSCLSSLCLHRARTTPRGQPAGKALEPERGIPNPGSVQSDHCLGEDNTPTRRGEGNTWGVKKPRPKGSHSQACPAGESQAGPPPRLPRVLGTVGVRR